MILTDCKQRGLEANISDLPEGWTWASVDQITNNFDGQRIPVKEDDRAKRSGVFPYYGASGIIDTIDDFLFNGDFLLIGEDGANLLMRSTPIAFRAGGRFWVNNHAHVVQTRGEIPLQFLENYFNSIDLDPFVTGSAQPKLTQANMNRIPVPLAPLAEQKRIVAKVEGLLARVDAARERLDRVPKIMKRFRQAVLASACSGRLTEGWREEHPDVEPARERLQAAFEERRKADKKFKPNSPLEADQGIEVPGNWEWTTPYNLSQFQSNAICAGPFGTIFKARDFRDSGVPIIFLRHVAPGRYLTLKPGFMDRKKWEDLFREYSVYGGELLITKLGDPPGVCAVYPTGIGPAMVTPDVIKMSVNESVANPEFLMSYLNSDISRSLAFGVAYGSTRQRLNLPLFREIPVPLPPLEEQREIIRRVEALFKLADAIVQRVAAARLRADNLTQSILAKAFRGELVPTEAKLARREGRSYEPASVLLERIRAERAREKPQAKARRTRS